MKKVYMPTTEELKIMASYNANIYKYLTVKAIEAIIIDGINYPHKGKLEHQFKYVKENPDIARGVCLLYPEEIKHSEIAKLDFELCKNIIFNKDKHNNLDDIRYFDDAILDNYLIFEYAINELYDTLSNNPKYRYTYLDDNKLLDDIFSNNISKEKAIYKNIVFQKLASIEPAYILKLGNNVPYGIIEKYYQEAINGYANRYYIDASLGTEFIGKDILTNKTEDVKRLVRTIHQR